MSFKTRPGRASGEMRAPRSAHQAGFTLIELMIAMIVGSILIAMSFSIYTRMSVAYRSQQDISELQQTLRAAKMKIAKDVRSAGYLIPNGFSMNNGGVSLQVESMQVTNDTDAGDPTFSPDEIRVYYADADAVAVVTGTPNLATDPLTYVDVDDAQDFDVGDLVLFSAEVTPVTPSDPIQYDACLMRITGIANGATDTVTFAATGAPFNSAENNHCDTTMTNGNDAIMYRFGSRAYRIDPAPANRRTGILQMSPSGGLVANDWQLQGVGFTNLQLAVRYFQDADAVDQDGDGDPTRDWYSGVVAPTGVPIEVSMSLEVRPIRELDVVSSAATPEFIEDGGIVDHNRVGDWESIALFGVSDGSRPLQYQGDHIYRWSTSTIDIRNMGVGQ